MKIHKIGSNFLGYDPKISILVILEPLGCANSKNPGLQVWHFFLPLLAFGSSVTSQQFWTCRSFSNLLCIKRFESNPLNRTLWIKHFELNALNQTLWIKRFESNALNQTLCIKRFQTLWIKRFQSYALNQRFESNALNQTLRMERFR